MASLVQRISDLATRIASEFRAVRAEINALPTSGGAAAQVSYDDGATGLGATTVQQAIEALHAVILNGGGPSIQTASIEAPTTVDDAPGAVLFDLSEVP